MGGRQQIPGGKDRKKGKCKNNGEGNRGSFDFAALRSRRQISFDVPEKAKTGWLLWFPALPNGGAGWATLVGGWERKQKGLGESPTGAR